MPKHEPPFLNKETWIMKRIPFTAFTILLMGTLVYFITGGSIAEAAKKTVKAAAESSQFADTRHGKAGIDCARCHGKAAPKEGAEVENQRCLACHGPMETLAKKSEPKDFPDRNPHKSHLGEINCTVCHSEHGASKVYCLDCHKKFQMKMPEGIKKQ
jgi:mono/diheme cytochrome c family protein